MATAQRFEDLEVWQRARVMTSRVYQVTRCGEFARDFGLKDQIRRAAVSSMSIIAEGFERGGDKEFIQFLSNAKGSTGEVRSQLYVALDAGFIPPQVFDEIYGLGDETGRMIGGLMR